MADQRDVIEVLTHDHREVEQMFAELERLIGSAIDADKVRRKELVEQVTAELVRHSVAEETQVYPKVKEKVSSEEAARAEEEHAEAERTLKRLDDMDWDDPSFDEALRTLMAEVREHVAEEEGEMFPHMRTVFTADELVSMGKDVESFKKRAPTKPHPHTPHTPAARKTLGPIAALFDRLRS
jgi:hemerythrin superfamily protein